MIAFVSQLLLMMQPCFAVKMLGDFRIDIKKKEIEKAIESVCLVTNKNSKNANYAFRQFLKLCVKAIS